MRPVDISNVILFTKAYFMQTQMPLLWIFRFKDIVQPKKRGAKRVTNRFVLPSHTIAEFVFEHLKGYSHSLNLKKPVSAFRAKKCGVCFEVESATKNSEAS